MYVTLNQKFLNIIKSEIITVKNLSSKKKQKTKLNTLSSKNIRNFPLIFIF